MVQQKKKRRRLKKSVKITGCAMLLALSGFTLVTLVKYFTPTKIDVEQESNNDDFITPSILEGVINNYYSDSKTSYSYILKNKNEDSYIFSNSIFTNDNWETFGIEDSEMVFEEIIELDRNIISSYWVQEQKLLIKDGSISTDWKDSGKTRVVPESVPEFVFEDDDKCWYMTNKKLIVDENYNIFKFMQVYEGSDGSLFMGINEPNIINNIYWKYKSSLTDFITYNKNINITK